MSFSDFLLATAGLQGALTILLHVYIRWTIRREETSEPRERRKQYRSCALPPEMMRPPQLRPMARVAGG